MLGRVCNEGGVIRLCPAGRLDSLAVAAIRCEIEALAPTVEGRLVIDLDDVTFIDGAGVAMLAFLFRRMREAGGSLAVVCAAGQPLAALCALGLAPVLALAPAAEPRGAWPVHGRWPGRLAADEPGG